MTYEQLIAYLKTHLTTVGIYSGFIPETADLPAIAVTNISYAGSRDLEGFKSRKSSTWRLTLVDDPDTLQTLIDNVAALDNNVTADRQRLFVDLALIEPIEPIEPNQRAFVNLTLFQGV